VNFRHLQAFHWIVRLGSFAAAAQRLNMTQSTISARIRELEQTLNVEVFDRSHRTVRVTPAGQTLIPLAEEALALGAIIYTTVGTRDAIAGLVKIGVGEIVAMTWFSSLLGELAKLYPEVEVEMIVDLTVNLDRMLLSGQIDLALMVAADSPNFIRQSVGRTPMRWMAHPSLKLQENGPRPENIARHPIFTLSRKSHLHTHVLNWFALHKVRPSVIHGCNSISAMIAMTRKAQGVAVLPTELVQDELDRGELELLEIESAIDHYEFFVVRDRVATDPAILAIQALALEMSTFDRDGFAF
jgi:DNA-binding transcriptional LysR family regulator